MKRKILVAIDGSTYSSNSLGYLGLLFGKVEDVCFHLLSIVTCDSLPPGKEWLDEKELMNMISSPTRKNLASAKTYMATALRKLEQLGISEYRVTTEVRLSRAGVATDILQEAKNGLYDALLIGRRGLSKLEELMIGSVSASILEKNHEVPIWVLDGQITSHKFLVPVDGTYHSLMAVDHLAHMIKDNPLAEITLFHSSAMFSHECVITPSEFYEQWGQEWCEEHLSRPDSLFHAPRQILTENGFPAEKIFWLHTFKGFDPSRQIYRQALIDDFGTVVMGRRGDDIDKGIFRGVTDRMVLMAENVAIWIVG
ncbi:MAG: universal stress protein [Proteobacteria bacterium]|nr:universal stress protein [Pseudomonadota bacterium]MBU1715867.1 universal stress protein [Pseudomonadota bacterium]